MRIDDEAVRALKARVAEQLIDEMTKRREWNQNEWAARLSLKPGTFSGYKGHPSTMSPEFIRRLAALLPEEFGWAWKKYEDIVAPEGLAANHGDSDRIREGLDRSIEATRELLKQLRMVRNQLS